MIRSRHRLWNLSTAATITSHCSHRAPPSPCLPIQQKYYHDRYFYYRHCSTAATTSINVFDVTSEMVGPQNRVTTAPPPETVVDEVGVGAAVTTTAHDSDLSLDPLPPPLPLITPNSPNSPDQTAKLQKRRRLVSQFIPMWLRRETSWREAVFQHLNLPTTLTSNTTNNSHTTDSNSNINSSNSSNNITHQRRNFGRSLQGNFYEETIPSFTDALQMGPPPQLQKALDLLVTVGLGNQKVAERYRTTYRIRLRENEWIKAFNEKKEQMQYHRGLVQQLTTEMAQVRERLRALLTKAKATTSTITTQQVLNLEKILAEKSANCQTHQQHVDTIMKMLNGMRTTDPPPMDNAEFQKISDAIDMARHDITLVFANHARDLHSKMLERYQMLDSKTDLTKPHEWYLHARLMKRRIIYHGGPTNSGKTYQALQRLKVATKGMYVGPLRLLAAEIWERLTAEGVYCGLFTGQEFRTVPFATHKSATVEMVALQEDFDVVVIDEIQMINDKERGFAWTRALLGLRCQEIHVCGGLEATDIVKRLVEACGDDFELRTYERFSELQIENQSLASMPDQLGAYQDIKPGDCVVAFSRNDIFAIKREIETNTQHKCCVIYGSLPPSTRSEQARRFNDPNSGYDVLVASDAIGMGMNLNIRRIILNSIFKNDGFNIVRLDHSSMKQISGRAGRRNSPFPNGVVTTRDPRDMEYLRQCLTTDIEPIEKAGLLPTATHIQTFSDALEQLGMRHGTKNLHTILQQFNDIASVKSDYFVCRQDPMVHVAKAIAPYDLAIPDKYMVCQSPIGSHKDQTTMDIVRRFVAKKSTGQSSGLTKNMIPKPPQTFGDLAKLCLIFSELELFLWLQRKFPPGNMIEQQAANTLRERAIEYISDGLNNAEELDLTHCYVRRDRGVRDTWTKSQSEVDDIEKEFQQWNDNAE